MNPTPRAADALLFRPTAITTDGRPPAGRGPQAWLLLFAIATARHRPRSLAVRPLAGAGRNGCEDAGVLEQIVT